VAVHLGATPAYAQTPPDPTAKVRAQQRFQDGEKAYKEGDYRRAAEAFEAAYREVRHHVPLYNGARAWAKAGERARAATDYDRFLDIAPAQDPDRPTATSALKQLSAELGQFQLARDDVDEIKVDGVVADGARVFVVPGVHGIEGKKGAEVARKTERVGAGEVVHIRFDFTKADPAPAAPIPVYPTPATPSAPAPQPAPELATSPTPAPAARSGWSPAVVAVEGALTGALLVATIWSGLNAVAYKHGDFAANENEDTLGEGVFRERRTNVLLGTTIGLAVITGVTALFLVDWKGKPGTQVGAR
jgi:hypothetical protein